MSQATQQLSLGSGVYSWHRGRFAVTSDIPNRLSSEDVGTPNSMGTLNVDVQLDIMSFLSTSDLSVLVRTCQHFLKIGIPSLCLRVGNKPIESVQQIFSFRDFLRVDTPRSRDQHVTSLWFRLPEVLDPGARTNTLKRPEHWNAFLTILYNCRGLRRLRIDTWDDRVDSVLVLNAISTSLKSLDDLSIVLTPELIEDFQRLSLTGLRRLTIQWPGKSQQSLDLKRMTLWVIKALAKTLVELNNVIPRSDVRVPFALVQKLGLVVDRSETFVRDAVRTFPNVTHLTMYSEHHRRCHWDVEGPSEDKALRGKNEASWSKDYPHAWPSLTAIWSEDLCGAYCLGLARSIEAISLPLTLDSRFYMLPTIVAEMHPRFLELRVDLDDPRICTGILDRLQMPDWRWLANPSNAWLSHLTLLLEGLDRVPVYATYETEGKLVLDSFSSALRRASLTHLLLRYPGPQYAQAIVADALPCATRLARACPTLCWIGVEACEEGLHCWDVSRARDGASTGAQARGTDPRLVKMDGDAGRKVLGQEGMVDFKYVRL